MRADHPCISSSSARSRTLRCQRARVGELAADWCTGGEAFTHERASSLLPTSAWSSHKPGACGSLLHKRRRRRCGVRHVRTSLGGPPAERVEEAEHGTKPPRGRELGWMRSAGSALCWEEGLRKGGPRHEEDRQGCVRQHRGAGKTRTLLGNSGKPVTLETSSLTKFSKYVFQEQGIRDSRKPGTCEVTNSRMCRIRES
jgi:hypothetical protein